MSNDDPFDGPGGSSVTWEDHQGRLILITPRQILADFPTLSGPAEVIRGDVVVLDGPGSPVEYRETVVFPRVLQGQVRANCGTGRSNLGRLGKGEKKPGQTAPWQLAEPTDADKRIARDYLAGRAQGHSSTSGRSGSVGGQSGAQSDAPPF